MKNLYEFINTSLRCLLCFLFGPNDIPPTGPINCSVGHTLSYPNLSHFFNWLHRMDGIQSLMTGSQPVVNLGIPTQSL